MKDLKEVLRYMAYRYELRSMLPTGKESPFKWKGKMGKYREEAIDLYVRTPKKIQYKAHGIRYSIVIITTILVLYLLKIKFSVKFSVKLFLFMAFVAYLGEEFIGSLLWDVIKIIKKNGLIKGLAKIIIGLFICLCLIILEEYITKGRYFYERH